MLQGWPDFRSMVSSIILILIFDTWLERRVVSMSSEPGPEFLESLRGNCRIASRLGVM